MSLEFFRRWRLSARSLLRRPAYSVTALLILGLGIGAVATLWAVVDTVLIKPLPYPHSDRLVVVLEANPARRENASLIAPARLQDWNRMSQAFTAITGVYAENVTDTGGSEPQRYAADRVSPHFFQVFGAPPLLGRTFNAAEEQPETGGTGPPAAVISYGMWTRRYARSPSAIGSRLILGGVGYTVIGVMPASFAPSTVDLWLPANIPAALMSIRDARFYSGIGRMKPGVTIAQAKADLDRVEQQLGRQYPLSDAGWSASVSNLKDFRVGSVRGALWFVFAALAMLFLIAVANIAGLTLTQLQRRERELAIRSAIGASRFQVVGTLMREVILLAAAGAVLGGLLASAAVKTIAARATTLPRMAELTFDWRAWAFAALAAVVAAAGFGVVPALRATRLHLSGLLSPAAAAGGESHRWLQRGLVVAQLAITVGLLACAGLLAHSYYELAHADPGFDADHVYTFHVGAGWGEDRTMIGQMQLRLLAGLRALPGSSSAGFTNYLPLSNATLQFQIHVDGLTGGDAKGMVSVGERTVSSDYLATLGVPLEAGSWCPATPPMSPTATPAALVNQRFVDVYGRGQNLVGSWMRWAQNPASAPPERIVGVVGDVREDAMASPPSPFLYDCEPAGSWPDPEYVVRSRLDQAGFAAGLRQVVHQVAPGRAIFGLHPLNDDIAASLEQPRLNLGFLSLFAGLAMALAAIGLYSLISLLVMGRTREIGLRIALGARPGEILSLVAATAGRLVLLGTGLGLLFSLAAVEWLKSLLYQVQPLDAASLAGAVAVLLAICALAVWIPARRAARTDPWQALRQE